MSPSSRMLRLLSLLQAHRVWSGPELAMRLDVSERTLRRDVDRLRELGYAVEAARGVAGGYQLRAGGQLPPLLLEDEEAVAIAVGLRQAAAGAVAGMEETSVQALTKLTGLLPPHLRRQLDALRSQTDSVVFGGGPVVDAAMLTTLAQACRDAEPLRFAYTARGREPGERWVEPHRLVSLGRRWYLVAWDRGREDWRSFRVDRVREPRAAGARFARRAIPGGDAAAFVQAGIRQMPQRHAVRILVDAPLEEIAPRFGRWASVTDAGEGRCRVEMNVETLEWPVFLIATVDAVCTVESPPELVEQVALARTRLGRAAAA